MPKIILNPHLPKDDRSLRRYRIIPDKTRYLNLESGVTDKSLCISESENTRSLLLNILSEMNSNSTLPKDRMYGILQIPAFSDYRPRIAPEVLKNSTRTYITISGQDRTHSERLSQAIADLFQLQGEQKEDFDSNIKYTYFLSGGWVEDPHALFIVCENYRPNFRSIQGKSISTHDGWGCAAPKLLHTAIYDFYRLLKTGDQARQKQVFKWLQNEWKMSEISYLKGIRYACYNQAPSCERCFKRLSELFDFKCLRPPITKSVNRKYKAPVHRR